MKQLDQIIQVMKDAGLDLTVEGDVSDLLGVNSKRNEDDTANLPNPISLIAFSKNWVFRVILSNAKQHLLLQAASF